MRQQWREAKEGDADVMVPGDDDEDMATDFDQEDVAGDEVFNRCINDTLEAQEVHKFV